MAGLTNNILADQFRSCGQLFPKSSSVQPASAMCSTFRGDCPLTSRALPSPPPAATHLPEGFSTIRRLLPSTAVGHVLPRRTRSVRACASQYGESESDDDASERERELLRALNLDPEDLEDLEDPVPGNEAVEEQVAGKDGDVDDVTRALKLDPQIPSSSSEFLAKVSSPEYQMRRRLEQTLSTTAFDVVEDNPWREPDKPVFVLANQKEQLFTMRTRRPRREVEYELDMLFRKRKQDSANAEGSSSSAFGRAAMNREASNGGASSHSRRTAGSSSGIARPGGFRMHVEDIREGILVFEDAAEAAQYCRVLDGEGEGDSNCMGVAQFQANELFKVCEKSKALAVIFKKGSLPPSPEYLRHTLKARKESLEDSEF